MDEMLLNFLGRERERMVRIGEKTCVMRLLSARETLVLRREIAVFACAEDVENTLSIGEINELVQCYAMLDRVENPSAEAGRESVEKLKKAWSTRPMSG